MKFIDVLLENGYKAYHVGCNSPAKDPYFYSSAQQIDKSKSCGQYHFYKDNEVGEISKAICVGLNQIDKPVVIKYPRPRTAVYDMDMNPVTGTFYDDSMIILCDNENNQTILDVINGTKKTNEGFKFEFQIDKHQQVKNITKWE